MNYDEAIKILNNIFADGKTDEMTARAIFLGICALKKQCPVPMQNTIGWCECGKLVCAATDNYCSGCGQKLDWGNENG